MQAFIPEVNVESKINLDLQNTQTIKNSQISNSSISFSDLLKEAKTEKVEANEKSETKAFKADKSEKSPEKETVKTESTEKNSEKVTENHDVEEKSVEKLPEVSKEKIVLENFDETESLDKKTDLKKEKISKKDSKIEAKSNGTEKKTEVKEKSDSKEIKNTKSAETTKGEKTVKSKNEKSENAKKLQNDFNRMEELTEKNHENEVVETIASYVPVQNEEKKDIKIEVKSENQEELNSISEITADSGNEKGIIENSKSEKISYLDEKGKIVVRDQRTENVEEKGSEKEIKNFTTEVHFENENTATITMDLNTNANNVQSDVLSLNNQVAASDGSNFQAMLNNQIQANIPEFVKAGSIVLKDNNQGSINLILHPDDIGNVKISLSLDGKSITGHIVVATKEAMEVFKDNAQDLREAFIKNGFDAANFDVSYNNNSNSNQNGDFKNQFTGEEFFAKRVYNQGQSDTVQEFSGKDNFIEKFSEYSINIVA